MGALARAKAEARCRESRIEDRLQDLQNRLLNKTVYHGRNAELAGSTAGLGDFHPAHGFGLIAAVEQRGDQPLAVLAQPRKQFGDGHRVHSGRALVRFDPLIGLVEVRRTRDLLHQHSRQGSLLFKRRERLWLRARSRSGSAFAGCAEAQRCLQGLVEQVQLVTAALPPLHAHRVGSDCSLAAEFGPSPAATPPTTTASADSSPPVGRRCRRPTPDRPEKRGGLPG
jgi:hypothetical protein